MENRLFNNTKKSKEYLDKLNDYLKSILIKQEEQEKKFNAWNNFLNKCSMFDCDVIGNALAKLITKIENEEYVYYKASCEVETTTMTRYGEDSKINYKSVFMINKQSNKVLTYRQKDGYFLFCKSFDVDENVIVLALIDKPFYLGSNDKSNVSFYKDYLVKTIDVKDFTYVYDFVDYVMEFKCNKRKNEISSEELDYLISEFLTNYDYKNNKVKTKTNNNIN